MIFLKVLTYVINTCYRLRSWRSSWNRSPWQKNPRTKNLNILTIIIEILFFNLSNIYIYLSWISMSFLLYCTVFQHFRGSMSLYSLSSRVAELTTGLRHHVCVVNDYEEYSFRTEYNNKEYFRLLFIWGPWRFFDQKEGSKK